MKKRIDIFSEKEPVNRRAPYVEIDEETEAGAELDNDDFADDDSEDDEDDGDDWASLPRLPVDVGTSVFDVVQTVFLGLILVSSFSGLGVLRNLAKQREEKK